MATPQQAIESKISISQDTKIALCWISLGPYHLARAQALSALCNLMVIEFARSHKQYGWKIDREKAPFPIVTLSEKAWEESNYLITSWRCWRELSRLQPEVVIVPGYASAPALAMALWGFCHRVPRILMSESTAADRPRHRWKESLKRRLVMTLYSAASFGGRSQLRYLEQLGFQQKKTAPFYNVVDNQFFSSGVERTRRSKSSADFSLPEGYFLYVGRLAPEKNLETLLRAFASYHLAGGQDHLVIAGDGPLKSDLFALASELKIVSEVHFVGHKHSDDLIPIYAFAKSLILPSLSEPWGLVVNEAMASGLPVVISTKCGCAEDLVTEGENGYLFDPLKEEQITDCMLRMSRLNEQEKRVMRVASKEKIDSYSPASWANALMQLANTL
jgi:glycosyltransferase involved in cell wall biosynthesis